MIKIDDRFEISLIGVLFVVSDFAIMNWIFG